MFVAHLDNPVSLVARPLNLLDLPLQWASDFSSISRRHPLNRMILFLTEYARSNGNHLSRLPTLPNTHPENHTNLLEARTLTQHDHEHFFPRTATVEFAPTRHALHHGRKGSIAELTESPTITSAVRRRSRSRSEADRSTFHFHYLCVDH